MLQKKKKFATPLRMYIQLYFRLLFALQSANLSLIQVRNFETIDDNEEALKVRIFVDPP